MFEAYIYILLLIAVPSFFFGFPAYKIVIWIRRLEKGKGTKGYISMVVALSFVGLVIWAIKEIVHPSDSMYKNQFEKIFKIPFPKNATITVKEEGLEFDLHGKEGFCVAICGDSAIFSYVLTQLHLTIDTDTIHTIASHDTVAIRMWRPCQDKTIVKDYVERHDNLKGVLLFMNDHKTIIFQYFYGYNLD